MKTNDYKKGHNKYDVIRYNETIPLFSLCNVTWVIHCIVGEKRFHTDTKKYECATNNDLKIKNIVIGISAVVSSCILVVVLVVCLKRHDYCFKCNDNQEGQEQPLNTTSQPEENISMLNTSSKLNSPDGQCSITNTF